MGGLIWAAKGWNNGPSAFEERVLRMLKACGLGEKGELRGVLHSLDENHQLFQEETLLYGAPCR